MKKITLNLTKLAILTCGLGSLYAQANEITDKVNSEINIAENITEQAGAEIEQQAISQIVGQLPLQFENLLVKIYAANNYQPLWQDKAAQKQFLKEYSALVLSGISQKSATTLESIASLSSTELAYDILLTDAFLDYLYYSKNLQKFAQQWLYSSNAYKANAPQESHIEAWLTAVKEGNNLAFIQTLSTTNPLYTQTMDYLTEAFAQLPEQQAEPDLVLTTTLKPGMYSEEIPTLIKMLRAKGLLTQPIEGNYYNDTLVSAVKKLQEKNGLAPDGIVGSATRSVLNQPTGKALLYKLAINAQRLKVISDFDNGLFVNVPSYRLEYYRDGEKVLTSRVIVGTKARKTPVMYSELSNLVINPPWNAPVRLINEDIIPKVRQDPSYIYRNGYTIIDSKGRSIDPYTIDWENMTSKNFPYRLRQQPGDDSALGRYKFNMPSSDAIYLHDTPRKDLFARQNRALSSGCVRVEKSDELATILLNEAGWNESRKQTTLASKRTTSVPIHVKHPVYLYYVTVWVDQGKLHNLLDIYNYDVTPNLNKINWAIISNFLLEK